MAARAPRTALAVLARFPFAQYSWESSPRTDRSCTPRNSRKIPVAPSVPDVPSPWWPKCHPPRARRPARAWPPAGSSPCSAARATRRWPRMVEWTRHQHGAGYRHAAAEPTGAPVIQRAAWTFNSSTRTHDAMEQQAPALWQDSEDPSRTTTAAQPGLGPTHRSTATSTTTRAGGCSPVETPSSPSAEGVRDTRDPVPARPGRGRAAARHGPRPSANHRQPAERPDAPRTQAQLPRVPDGIAQFLPRITAVIRRVQAQAELAEEGKRWESAP